MTTPRLYDTRTENGVVTSLYFEPSRRRSYLVPHTAKSVFDDGTDGASVIHTSVVPDAMFFVRRKEGVFQSLSVNVCANDGDVMKYGPALCTNIISGNRVCLGAALELVMSGELDPIDAFWMTQFAHPLLHPDQVTDVSHTIEDMEERERNSPSIALVRLLNDAALFNVARTTTTLWTGTLQVQSRALRMGTLVVPVTPQHDGDRGDQRNDDERDPSVE